MFDFSETLQFNKSCVTALVSKSRHPPPLQTCTRRLNSCQLKSTIPVTQTALFGDREKCLYYHFSHENFPKSKAINEWYFPNVRPFISLIAMFWEFEEERVYLVIQTNIFSAFSVKKMLGSTLK